MMTRADRRVRIAVTGLGSVSPFGDGADALWHGLLGSAPGGPSGVVPIDRFGTAHLGSHLAALVKGSDPRKAIPAGVLRRIDPSSKFAVPAAAQALEQAKPAARERVGVILGTNCAGSVPVAEFLRTVAREGASAAPPILFPYTVANAPASQCALILGLRGPNLTIVQREASSCGAIAVACQMLASGAAEGLLAGGADDVSEPVFEVLDRLGVLSRDRTAEGGAPEGSRPFDARRNGVVCGEGSAFLFLEREEDARRRGAEVLATIDGAGVFRSPTAPHAVPDRPEHLARAAARVLEMARAPSSSIDAIFGSASSSVALDAVEAAALRLAFEGAVPPVVSVRGALGDSGIGAAASTVAACFALRNGRLPGTAGLTTPDAALGLRVSPDPVSLPLRRMMITGFASGGSAGAVILSAPLL